MYLVLVYYVLIYYNIIITSINIRFDTYGNKEDRNVKNPNIMKKVHYMDIKEYCDGMFDVKKLIYFIEIMNEYYDVTLQIFERNYDTN